MAKIDRCRTAVKHTEARSVYQIFCILSPSQVFFRKSGPWFSIKMPSYQYRKSHCGDKTVVRSSYLHYGISYTGKMASFYWIRTLICKNASFVDKYSKVTYACLASFILSAYSVVSANYLSSWGNSSTCDRTNITSRQAVYTFYLKYWAGNGFFFAQCCLFNVYIVNLVLTIGTT